MAIKCYKCEFCGESFETEDEAVIHENGHVTLKTFKGTKVNKNGRIMEITWEMSDGSISVFEEVSNTYDKQNRSVHSVYEQPTVLSTTSVSTKRELDLKARNY